MTSPYAAILREREPAQNFACHIRISFSEKASIVSRGDGNQEWEVCKVIGREYVDAVLHYLA
jgi:hypothetical protein